MGKCKGGQTCCFLLAKEGRDVGGRGDLKERWVAVDATMGVTDSWELQERRLAVIQPLMVSEETNPMSTLLQVQSRMS